MLNIMSEEINRRAADDKKWKVKAIVREPLTDFPSEPLKTVKSTLIQSVYASVNQSLFLTCIGWRKRTKSTCSREEK
jgi:hypothetical protein